MSEIFNARLTYDDEFVHQAPDGARDSWRESYYFGFYDPAADVGGFESFGYRPRKRHSGSMVTFWKPGEVTAGLDFGGALEDRSSYRVGAFRASCRDPFRRWELSHTGMLRRRRPAPIRQPVDQLERLAEAVPVEVELRCTFESAGWLGLYDQRPSYQHVFTSCYEQVGLLRGNIRLGDDSHAIECPCVRHHAWGERDWFRDDEWNWCTVALDDASAAGFWYRRKGDHEEVNGWLYLDGNVEPVSWLERKIDHEPAELKALPRQACYLIHDRSGRSLELVGTVLQITPAFFRPSDHRPLLHWNDRSLVSFSSPRGKGYGEIEFIETLSDPSQN